MKPEDIVDIRGPIAIPYWWIPYAVGVAVVVLLLLAWLAVRAIVRRRRARALSASEIALRRIERARALLATGSSAEFSAEVSDAVRAYIEARFALRASHRTTEEFLHELLAAEASPICAHRDALADFLSLCDLAKFARLVLDPSHADSMIDSARRFVQTTAESGEPPPTADSRPKLAVVEVGT